MTQLRLLAVPTLIFACAVFADGADPPGKPALPDAVYAQLIEPSAKLIQDSLAGEPTRRAAEKARVAALMLAEFAQQNLQGADAAQRASVRDASLHVAGLIRDKKYEEAVQHARRLPKLLVNPAAKKERVKMLGTHMEIDELMGQFRGVQVGGLGIEKLYDQLSANKNMTIPALALTEDLQLTALRTAVAAELSREHTVNMNPKEWLGYAEGMRKSALELADAAAAKNGKAAFAALDRLNTSCNQCHQKYR